MYEPNVQNTYKQLQDIAINTENASNPSVVNPATGINGSTAPVFSVEIGAVNPVGTLQNLKTDTNGSLLVTIQGVVMNVTATSPLFSSGGLTPNLTIQQSSSTQNGYLSAVDWITFNNKQPLIGPQASNIVLSGPNSGSASTPSFRSLTIADLPAMTGQSFITSGTTYTTPANIDANTVFKFTLIGGGGGGGGNTTTNGHSCGGGGGGTGIVWLTGLSPSTAYSISIGAAGAQGPNTPGPGGPGGNTTLTVGVTTYTAGGGGGGTATVNTSAGGAGGTVTNCTISIAGQNGAGSGSASTVGVPGAGGSSGLGYGMGGVGTVVFVGNDGFNGTGYGGGGSGTTGVGIGGTGSQGAILVEWKN